MLTQSICLVGQSFGEPSFGWVKIVENSGAEAKVILAVLALMSCWSLGALAGLSVSTHAIATSCTVGGRMSAGWKCGGGHQDLQGKSQEPSGQSRSGVT